MTYTIQSVYENAYSLTLEQVKEHMQKSRYEWSAEDIAVMEANINAYGEFSIDYGHDKSILVYED